MEKGKRLKVVPSCLEKNFTGKKGLPEETLKLAKKQGFPVSDTIETELQNVDVFHKDISWKTFVPPPPQHTVSFTNFRVSQEDF